MPCFYFLIDFSLLILVFLRPEPSLPSGLGHLKKNKNNKTYFSVFDYIFKSISKPQPAIRRADIWRVSAGYLPSGEVIRMDFPWRKGWERPLPSVTSRKIHPDESSGVISGYPLDLKIQYHTHYTSLTSKWVEVFEQICGIKKGLCLLLVWHYFCKVMSKFNYSCTYYETLRSCGNALLRLKTELN